MAVRANMHMDVRVIELADYKSDIKFNLKVYGTCPQRPSKLLSEAKCKLKSGHLRFLI